LDARKTQLTNTTTEMEYQVGGSKTWIACMEGTTTGVQFVEGDIEVREIANTDNNRVIATLTIPAAPEITIDYLNETTAENITSDIMYSYDLVNVFYGDGNPLAITPGQVVYFAYIATATDLASEVQNITIPTRPDAPTTPIVNDDDDLFGWTNNPNFPNTTDYEYSINAGGIWFNVATNPIYVGDVSIPAGNVQVRVKAVDNTNFKSNELVSDVPFNEATNINDVENNISIFPNPVTNFVTIYSKNIISIEILNTNGKTINYLNINSNTTTIDFSDFSKGIYIMKINTDNSFYTKKIIKL